MRLIVFCTGSVGFVCWVCLLGLLVGLCMGRKGSEGSLEIGVYVVVHNVVIG